MSSAGPRCGSPTSEDAVRYLQHERDTPERLLPGLHQAPTDCFAGRDLRNP